MMSLPHGFDRWKLSSPEDEAPALLKARCDGCDALVDQEHLAPVPHWEGQGRAWVCPVCLPGQFIQCEGCGVDVLEDEAILINDGSIDHTPKVCGRCAK